MRHALLRVEDSVIYRHPKAKPIQSTESFDGVATVYRGGKWVTTGRRQRLVSYDVHNFFKK